MAETTKFLAATAYTHINFMDRDKMALTNGIRWGEDGELACTCAGGDMNVAVAAGKAFLDGAMYVNSASKNLAQTADAAEDRINRIVLRWDVADGIVDLQTLAGTPGTPPAAPALTWDGTTKEISLCQVYILAAAATIATSDITPEYKPMSAAGPLVVELMRNDSGAALPLGAVVIGDATGDRYFNTTATARDLGVYGVVAEDDGIADDAYGRVVTHGVALVNMDAATTRHQLIRASATAGKATPTSNPEIGVFGRALATTGGAGLCLCELWGAVMAATATPTANCLVAYNATGHIPDNSVPSAAIDGTLPASDLSARGQCAFEWHFSGVVTTGANTYHHFAPFDVVLTDGYLGSATAPTGSDMVFDIHSGEGAGTTIFTTQPNRPTLASGGDGPTAIVAPDVVNIAKGTRLVAYCDTADSNAVGADLTLTLIGTKALV